MLIKLRILSGDHPGLRVGPPTQWPVSLLKREDTQKNRADCDMKAEAEIGGIPLPAKELTGLQACW